MPGKKNWCFRVYPAYTPVYWSIFEMYPLCIPLLCKERLGEVESWHPREPTMVSAFECCEEATSPSPLLTKEGTLGRSPILFTHANVRRTETFIPVEYDPYCELTRLQRSEGRD